VIIGDLNIVCPIVLPEKADAVLIVDPNAVLALSVALQSLQPIPRWNTKVFERV
jgi:hypothetical protein